jgi:hypothetical protein
MRRIMKHTMLIRVPGDLPVVLTTDELLDGWGFIRPDDAPAGSEDQSARLAIQQGC